MNMTEKFLLSWSLHLNGGGGGGDNKKVNKYIKQIILMMTNSIAKSIRATQRESLLGSGNASSRRQCLSWDS